MIPLMVQRGVSCFQCDHLRPLSPVFFQKRPFRDAYGKCAACPQVVAHLKAELPQMYAAHARMFPSWYAGCGPEGARFVRRRSLLERALGLLAEMAA